MININIGVITTSCPDLSTWKDRVGGMYGWYCTLLRDQSDLTHDSSADEAETIHDTDHDY